MKGDLVYGYNGRIIWKYLGFKNVYYASKYILVEYIEIALFIHIL